MKIGILTFHRTTNYGAALQAYALQEALTSAVDEAELIDYRNMNIYSYYDPRFFHNLSLKTRIGKLLRYSYNTATFDLFVEFWKKYFHLSPECTTNEELRSVEQRYDAVVCGSDQVWNPRAIFQDYDAFLLGTVDCRKISYAASAGAVSLWEPYLKKYWTLLHRFDAISVRETDMKEPTEHLAQKKVQVVLDPTLLLNKTDWCKAESEEMRQKLPKNGYILIYFLGKNPAVIQAAKELQKQTGLPIISLGRKIKGVKAMRPIAGPEEFLTLFHYASYVLTSSFHGTVFSIQYQRPFLVFGNGAYNSRMNTLLGALDLQGRMVDQASDSVWEKMKASIDWEHTEACHNREKQKSLAFLSEAFGKNGEKE